MRHPDTGQYSTHAQIATDARLNAEEHDQAANEADAEARAHGTQATIADRKGDRRSAIQHHHLAETMRTVAAGHKNMASASRRLALHHEAKLEPPSPNMAKAFITTPPQSAEEFFAHFGVR